MFVDKLEFHQSLNHNILYIDILIDLSRIFEVTVDYLVGNREIESASLSKYELELIKEARSADERARFDALLLLQSHKD